MTLPTPLPTTTLALVLLALPMVAFGQLKTEPNTWNQKISYDGFTDEPIWIAYNTLEIDDHWFTIFLNCRSQHSISVGIVATKPSSRHLNPSRSAFRVRFDDEKPRIWRFDKQQRAIFLDEEVPLHKYIFVKKMADANRMRIEFPTNERDFVLDYSMRGSRASLSGAAIGCESKLSVSLFPFVYFDDELYSFQDADGVIHLLLVDLLNDETWQARKGSPDGPGITLEQWKKMREKG